jgi:hypothetical protein
VKRTEIMQGLGQEGAAESGDYRRARRMQRLDGAVKLFAALALAFFVGCVTWAVTKPSQTQRVAVGAPLTSVSVPARMTAAPAVAVTTRRTVRATPAPPVKRKGVPAVRIPKRTEPIVKVPERYRNCTALRRAHPGGVPAGHPAYERKHDRDRDGFACETSKGLIVKIPKPVAPLIPKTPDVSPSTLPSASADVRPIAGTSPSGTQG